MKDEQNTGMKEFLDYNHAEGCPCPECKAREQKDRPELPEEIPALCVVNMVEGRGYPNCVKPLIEEAKKQERKRIQKAYEGEWYSVTDTYCPEWIVDIRQALEEGGEQRINP